MLKNADLEAFAVPLANNMEAIWAVSVAPGKLYTRLSTKKSLWRAYFMGLHAKRPWVKFPPELHFITLMETHQNEMLVRRTSTRPDRL